MDNVGIIFVSIILAAFIFMIIYSYSSYTPEAPQQKSAKLGAPPPTDYISKPPPPTAMPRYSDSDSYTQLKGDYKGEQNWEESIVDNIDPAIRQQHTNFTNNVRRFGGSSVRHLDLDDLSMNAVYMNFRGLKRPAFVPIRDSNREVPSYYTYPFKNYKRYLI